MWIPEPGWLPAASFAEPVAIPTPHPLDAPTVCLAVNTTWLPYVLGALAQLSQPPTWDTGSPTALNAVLDDVQDLMSAFGAAGACTAPNSALFNGIDNYLSAGPSSAFDFSGSGAWSAWAWVWTAGTGSIVNQNRNGSGGAGWTLDITPSGSNRNVLAAVNNGTTQSIAQAGNALYGMVAVTADAAHLRLFYQGSLINTTAATEHPAYGSTAPLEIGRRAGGSYLQGIMKDVQVYSGRVPDSDIAAIAAAGSGVSAGATLVAHWLLNEGTGTTAADSSGNGHTATLHGSTPRWAVFPT